MTTQENNNLIAEFLGITAKERKNKSYWYDAWSLSNAGLPFAPGAMGNGTDDLKFHSSWDWLMPVIDEIGKQIEEPDQLEFSTHYIIVRDGVIMVANYIDGVYRDVLEVIKWIKSVK